MTSACHHKHIVLYYTRHYLHTCNGYYIGGNHTYILYMRIGTYKNVKIYTTTDDRLKLCVYIVILIRPSATGFLYTRQIITIDALKTNIKITQDHVIIPFVIFICTINPFL